MKKHTSVTLFVQCIVDGLYPEVGDAVVRIFQRLGLAIDCPAHQTCCGQPAYNAGYRREARRAAKHFIEVFGDSEIIVCPSGSCVYMIRHHYPQLFEADPAWRARALEIAARTYELTEFLVDVIGVKELGARYAGSFTYHDSCHLLRGLRVFEQPRALLRHVAEAEFREMKNSDYCCGFGGTFAAKYPEISTAMVADKVNHIVQSGADTVVGCDMGCLMNIQGLISRRRLDIKVMHIAQILAG
jgi:L-lactate dehydrogenase complex protein LldE